MKIQINTEAELDIDDLADALDSTIDCKIDGFISELDLSDEIRDAMSERSFDYEIENALDDFDFSKVDELEMLESRVADLEAIISRLSFALPNKAFDQQLEVHNQLQTRYDDLENKFRKLSGLDGIEEDCP
tara:strand:- start:561 stop:953 length:393 start_codon:yes stop_codon:yes gene_type:complete